MDVAEDAVTVKGNSPIALPKVSPRATTPQRDQMLPASSARMDAPDTHKPREYSVTLQDAATTPPRSSIASAPFIAKPLFSPSSVAFAALPSRDPMRGKSLGGQKRMTVLGKSVNGSDTDHIPSSESVGTTVKIATSTSLREGETHRNPTIASTVLGNDLPDSSTGPVSCRPDFFSAQQRTQNLPQSSEAPAQNASKKPGSGVRSSWLRQAMANVGGEQGLRKSMAGHALRKKSEYSGPMDVDQEQNLEERLADDQREGPSETIKQTSLSHNVVGDRQPLEALPVAKFSNGVHPNKEAITSEQISDAPQSKLAKMLADLEEKKAAAAAMAALTASTKGPPISSASNLASRLTLGPGVGASLDENTTESWSKNIRQSHGGALLRDEQASTPREELGPVSLLNWNREEPKPLRTSVPKEAPGSEVPVVEETQAQGASSTENTKELQGLSISPVGEESAKRTEKPESTPAMATSSQKDADECHSQEIPNASSESDSSIDRAATTADKSGEKQAVSSISIPSGDCEDAAMEEPLQKSDSDAKPSRVVSLIEQSTGELPTTQSKMVSPRPSVDEKQSEDLIEASANPQTSHKKQESPAVERNQSGPKSHASSGQTTAKSEAQPASVKYATVPVESRPSNTIPGVKSQVKDTIHLTPVKKIIDPQQLCSTTPMMSPPKARLPPMAPPANDPDDSSEEDEEDEEQADESVEDIEEAAAMLAKGLRLSDAHGEEPNDESDIRGGTVSLIDEHCAFETVS